MLVGRSCRTCKDSGLGTEGGVVGSPFELIVYRSYQLLTSLSLSLSPPLPQSLLLSFLLSLSFLLLHAPSPPYAILIVLSYFSLISNSLSLSLSLSLYILSSLSLFPSILHSYFSSSFSSSSSHRSSIFFLPFMPECFFSPLFLSIPRWTSPHLSIHATTALDFPLFSSSHPSPIFTLLSLSLYLSQTFIYIILSFPILFRYHLPFHSNSFPSSSSLLFPLYSSSIFLSTKSLSLSLSPFFPPSFHTSLLGLTCNKLESLFIFPFFPPIFFSLRWRLEVIPQLPNRSHESPAITNYPFIS